MDTCVGLVMGNVREDKNALLNNNKGHSKQLKSF